MTITTANLGFPRIGAKRELKFALESYWAGKSGADALLETAKSLRAKSWNLQKDKGIAVIPSNDFSLYDHVLDTAVMVGAIPAAYGWKGGPVDLDTYFAMARGSQGGGHASCGHAEHSHGVPALEMTKWFDTNYHYMVPEFTVDQAFELTTNRPLEAFLEAKALGIHTRPFILGPLTFLKLGKAAQDGVSPVGLLDRLLPVYAKLIIYGDVSRPNPMTVAWWKYAQLLTAKTVKGMLTGPVTILNWSFVRDDLPRSTVCKQIALAIRDEVHDLAEAGAAMIQIDEAALREGLPLRRADWKAYLDWAVESFHLCSTGVSDETQIHTHMCYSEFNDTMPAIAAMDADVISIETSRSKMELLSAFTGRGYPNEIGPGVYDIHSPRVPAVEEMVELLDKASEGLVAGQIWVNPACGLKTRKWEEVKPALVNMVAAALRLRAGLNRGHAVNS